MMDREQKQPLHDTRACKRISHCLHPSYHHRTSIALRMCTGDIAIMLSLAAWPKSARNAMAWCCGWGSCGAAPIGHTEPPQRPSEFPSGMPDNGDIRNCGGTAGQDDALAMHSGPRPQAHQHEPGVHGIRCWKPPCPVQPWAASRRPGCPAIAWPLMPPNVDGSLCTGVCRLLPRVARRRIASQNPRQQTAMHMHYVRGLSGQQSTAHSGNIDREPSRRRVTKSAFQGISSNTAVPMMPGTPQSTTNMQGFPGASSTEEAVGCTPVWAMASAGGGNLLCCAKAGNTIQAAGRTSATKRQRRDDAKHQLANQGGQWPD